VQELRQKVLQKESGRRQDVVFPELFDENETDSVVRITVQRITEGKALEGWIEYLSSSDRLIVSQYRQAQNKSESSLLNNILSVYELKNEKMLYNEIIAKDVKTPSPDSFFIKDDLLFFINHQTMLTAIRIWKS
jgi:hypothetical protein